MYLNFTCVKVMFIGGLLYSQSHAKSSSDAKIADRAEWLAAWLGR